MVDAADYAVWRDSQGTAGVGLLADGDLDGTVDADDYTVWKAHFGETASGGGAGAVMASVSSTGAVHAGAAYHCGRIHKTAKSKSSLTHSSALAMQLFAIATIR